MTNFNVHAVVTRIDSTSDPFFPYCIVILDYLTNQWPITTNVMCEMIEIVLSRITKGRLLSQ